MKPRKMTDLKTEMMWDLYEKGASFDAIASVIGVCGATVRNYINAGKPSKKKTSIVGTKIGEDSVFKYIEKSTTPSTGWNKDEPTAQELTNAISLVKRFGFRVEI